MLQNKTKGETHPSSSFLFPNHSNILRDHPSYSYPAGSVMFRHIPCNRILAGFSSDEFRCVPTGKSSEFSRRKTGRNPVAGTRRNRMEPTGSGGRNDRPGIISMTTVFTVCLYFSAITCEFNEHSSQYCMEPDWFYCASKKPITFHSSRIVCG